jgi:hypothetical protein
LAVLISPSVEVRMLKLKKDFKVEWIVLRDECCLFSEFLFSIRILIQLFILKRCRILFFKKNMNGQSDFRVFIVNIYGSVWSL